MHKLVSFLIVFGILFLFYLIFVILNKKKVSKIFETKEANIIKSLFKVNFNKSNKLLFAFLIAITNGIIYATSYTILTLFKNVYIGFLVMVPVLIILIFLFYGIIGFIYKKKEGKKDV